MTFLRPMAMQLALLALLAQPLLANAPETSARPAARPAMPPPSETSTPAVKPASGFAPWRDDFRTRAMAQGIPPATFDAAFKGIRYDPAIVRKDRSQNEFTKTVWVYLDSAASDARIAAGQKALKKHRALLQRIESKYGVRKEIVTAIWGLESAYGTYRGTTPTIQALATLAYDGRRAAFFEGELIGALRILADGHTTPANMRGSWAGAMGHTQFMPTSWQDHAQDWTGDGRRDIWGDDPADALASAAAYLRANGWQTGIPWGAEVRLPAGFDYLMARRDLAKLPSDWARLGVTAANGKPVPDHGMATILLPGGARGAAFMIFANFDVIETYNTADAYVIGVGHLADRIAGASPLHADWPRDVRALSFDERIELQTRLTAAGFDTQKIDARIGPLTINATRAWQTARGLVPDGFPTPALLKRLRQEK